MAVDGKKTVNNTDNGSKGKFFREVKAEIKRITWPSKKDIKKATIAVASFCLLYIVFIGGVDLIFKNLFEFMFKIK